MYPIRCRCGTMRQTYQDPRCRWCGGCRRGLEYPWGNVAIPEIMRGLTAVPVGGGRAWRGIGMRRQTYQNIRCRWCGGCRRDEIAVPVGGGRAWPGFETTRRAKLAARTARGRAAAHRHTKQPGPTARCDGARSTRGTTHHRRQSARIPSQQRRQVDAPAARELGCLGAAREAVRQIHRVRLSIKRGQQRMRCDRD